MKIRDYQGHCWWCGATADSREHRHKKTDIVRLFGPGPYLGDDVLVRGVDDQPLRYVSGPDSQQFKFERTLCVRCNTTRSQPFDRAYEAFSSFISENDEMILTTGRFRWSEVFGLTWPQRLLDVKRYLVKHIACRIVEAGLEVDRAFFDFLDGSTGEPPSLICEMEIRSDIAAIPERGLWLGGLLAQKSRSTGEVLSVSSFMGFGWLRVNYDYGNSTDPPVTYFDDDLVRLPRRHNVDPMTIKRA